MKCRLCGGDGRVMFRLTPTPIANSFPEKPDQDADRYPLELQECFDCGHVQLKDYVSVDWVDYRYATPEAVRPHLREAAVKLKSRYPNARTVLEIGSNNGLYLEELKRAGFEATGVDPCGTDIKAPFTLALAKTLPKFDLVVANNVLAHVDDLQDALAGVDEVLGEDGALIFENQYFPDLIRNGSFDQIYHEHRDYHSLGPLKTLRRYGLVVRHFEFLKTHGGSIRVYCERPGIGLPLFDESIDWREFSHRIERAKRHVVSQMRGKVVAFGATAKACTLIHHFGIASKIAYCVDNTPAKQGRYIPGTAIRIYPESRLQEDTPDAVLLTAWNFEREIRGKYPEMKFIVPFSQTEAMKEAA